ncbi:putative protein kinase RLK-Pelle-SD-2b family [Helianthus anomalus]
MMNESRTNTGIRGTKGYVAPEWFRNTPVTIKVDVYSFGVLLLEIISCRKSVKENESDVEYGAILTDWAWDCYEERNLDVFVDNDLEAIVDYKKLTTFVMVSLWCVQEKPSLRPTMRKVIQMLEGVIEFVDAAWFGSTRLGSVQARCHDITPSCAPEFDTRSTKSHELTSP